MKKRGHEHKMRRLHNRAVRHSTPSSPAMLPNFLARRFVARLRKYVANGSGLSQKGQRLFASVQEVVELLHTNPWDSTVHWSESEMSFPGSTEHTSRSERLTTTLASQAHREQTTASVPEPSSSTGSNDEASWLTDERSPEALNLLTVKHLQARAKRAGLTGYSKLKKADLVAALASLS